MHDEEAAKELYLNVICRKYILVYYVDLNENQAKILRLAKHSNVWKMPEMHSDGYFDYDTHIWSFAEKYVSADKFTFIKMLDRSYIADRLKLTDDFKFRYECTPNGHGKRYYEVEVIRVNTDVYDGKVIIVSREIDDVIHAEQKQKAQLETERQYLNRLCWDYTAVYRINLKKNIGITLKIEDNTFVSVVTPFETKMEYPYTESVNTYADRFVTKEERERFRQALSPENLLQVLHSQPRFIFRYQSIRTPAGDRFFEAQAIRMTDDPENDDILLGFRHIDEIAEREERYRRELEARLEQERIQNESLEALGRNYHAIFRIDIETDTYIKVACQDSISYYYSDNPSASGMLRELCDKVVAKKHYARMRSFFDLSTLAKRLREREFVEVECITKDGAWHRAKIIAKRRDENGNVIHVLYVTQIINDEKQYEEHLIAKAEYAEFVSQTKSTFFSQVAHDIRTPMNSLFGFLEIAEANLDDREKVQYSQEKIRNAGEFLKDLVNDVLDISRMEEGKLKLRPTETNLAKLLDEVAVSMQNAKFGKTQEFHVDIDDIPYKNVKIDALRLKQIYTNILSNAIKYTPDGGRIEFSVHEEKVPDGERVRIIAVIADNGIGMSEEFMKKMFDKYERGMDTRINKVSGYGLGLSIVKELVNLMDGTIEVESQLGKGSAFRVQIEAPYIEETEQEVEADVDYSAVCAGMRLLAAEDNALNREVITELLAMHEIACECTENGEECLKRFRNAPEGEYDAILMDMQMPVMDGIETTRQIRMLPLPWAKSIPILAMTANAMKADVDRCLEAGMNRHLSKPIDIGQMMKTLAEIQLGKMK